MRTREKSYSDYGITEKEKNYIKSFCEASTDREKKIIINALTELSPYIARKVYESLVRKMSYDDLNKKEYMYLGKGDFYGYRRQGMDAIKRWMMLYGIWEL